MGVHLRRHLDRVRAVALGKYRPVTRFAQFVNVPELIAMFRSFADVVLPEVLRGFVKVPSIAGGSARSITAEPTAAFKAYQRRWTSASPRSRNATARRTRATIYCSRSSPTADSRDRPALVDPAQLHRGGKQT